MNRYIPERIVLLDDERVIASPVTKRVLERTAGKNIPVERMDAAQIEKLTGEILAGPDPFREGKKILLLTVNPGGFLKRCPGTNDYICCDYYIIDFAQNCPMDCTYCILQAYLNNPLMIVYANVSDLLAEIDEKAAAIPSFRTGTGEFTDSLALEHLTGYSELLMDHFEARPGRLIEFKSKTDFVEPFLNRRPPKNVLLSWSMNAKTIAAREEHKTATLAERLAAAKKCAEAGYGVTFHFDPIIDHENFEAEIGETVEAIFEAVPAERIKYISLGCFRFIPKLADIIAARFPASKIIYNEFIRGYDGKRRYFRAKRERLFSALARAIRRHDREGRVKIYLCMESPEMWRAVLGKPPACDEDLGGELYRCCRGAH